MAWPHWHKVHRQPLVNLQLEPSVDDQIDDLVVANTEFGRIIRVPVLADGRAGAPQIFVENCSLLAGADGLTIDRAANLDVAVTLLSTIVRVSPTGVLDVLATAADGLDKPASVVFGTGATRDTLYIRDFALFTAMSGGTPRPGLLALAVQVPLPKDTPKKG